MTCLAPPGCTPRLRQTAACRRYPDRLTDQLTALTTCDDQLARGRKDEQPGQEIVTLPVALWSIANGRPRRLEQRRDFLELDLEEWVHEHPELVMDGLTWVGRQVTLPDRSRPDLIGVTREGQLVVTELKRGRIDIGSLTQAFHYVLAIAAAGIGTILPRLELDEQQLELMPEEDDALGLDLAILLVGTARAPELDRAAAFLSDRGLSVPMRTVTFASFEDPHGEVLLAREVEDHEQEGEEDITPRQRSSRAARTEWVQQRARELEVADIVEEALRTADRLGLKVKPWPKAITIVPSYGLARTLLYLRPHRPGRTRLGYSSENLAALYGAEETDVQTALGENWVEVDKDTAQQKLSAFEALMTDLL